MGKAVNIVYSSTSSEGMSFIDGLIPLRLMTTPCAVWSWRFMFGGLERRSGKDLFSAQ
jgi:hypothetical protein